MQKRTAFISAILSLLPLGQPLFIKSGIVLSTTGFLLSFSEKVSARNFDYYFDRAYEKAENGDYYGAISDYTKAIEINPNYADAYYNRGNRKADLKDYYGAISDYTKAIDIDPNQSDVFKNRSIVKETIGDIDGACLDAKKSVSLGDAASDNQTWIKKNC